MVCDNCKQEIKETDKYCGNCGELITRPPSFNSEEMEKAKVFSNSMNKIIPMEKELLLKKDEEIKNNKKRFFKIAFIALILVIVSVLTFVYINRKNIFYTKEGKRTIMIYMIGSDLESKYLAATKDINEIIDSSIDYDDINIIVYTGGAKRWHNENISNDRQMLFEINKSGLTKLEEFNNKSMLESDNLLYLLNYGYENYDTEYYDLILWDHGAGPIYGYGYDEYNKNDSMTISKIKDALNRSYFMGEEKLELIGFDACLMSSIEVASSLSTYANYMVASQEFEPGSGWNYKFLEEIDSKTSSIDLGKYIIDYFEDYYKNSDYEKGISLSLLKLNKINNVIKYTDELFKEVDDNLVLDYSSISKTRSNSKSYGRIANDNYYYDLVDLNDLLNKMPDKYEKNINELKTALNDLVIYQKTDLENTNGVSIFFPFENKKDITSTIDKYKELDFSSSYYSFVKDFSNKLTGKRISNWDLTVNSLTSSGEGEVVLNINDEIINGYSNADYILFEKTKDGLFIPVYNGSDIVVEGNKMKTNVSKNTLVITDSEGNKMPLTAIESVRGVDYVSYYIPATVSRFDPDTLEIDIVSVYLDFVVDQDHKEGFVSGIYPMELNENLTYSKTEMKLEDWEEINLLSYRYKIIDEEGNYIKTWDNSGKLTTINLSTKDSLNIKFENIDISKDYYCIFRVRDSQNNQYYSNIVKVSKK